VSGVITWRLRRFRSRGAFCIDGIMRTDTGDVRLSAIH
jgi:hypothetical protein